MITLGLSEVFNPQLVATISILPFPSKSPVATPCQRPVSPDNPRASVISTNFPFWFLNTRIGPHSVVIINSGNLTDVLGYLESNTDAGETVAFAYDSVGDGANDGTMVWNNGTKNSLVLLAGLTGVDDVTAAAAGSKLANDINVI